MVLFCDTERGGDLKAIGERLKNKKDQFAQSNDTIKDRNSRGGREMPCFAMNCWLTSLV